MVGPGPARGCGPGERAGACPRVTAADSDASGRDTINAQPAQPDQEDDQCQGHGIRATATAENLRSVRPGASGRRLCRWSDPVRSAGVQVLLLSGANGLRPRQVSAHSSRHRQRNRDDGQRQQQGAGSPAAAVHRAPHWGRPAWTT